jgi:hypothetical protein
VSAISSLVEEPDFVISTRNQIQTLVNHPESANRAEKNVLQKLGEAFREKVQDDQLREAIQLRVTLWYLRINIIPSVELMFMCPPTSPATIL